MKDKHLLTAEIATSVLRRSEDLDRFKIINNEAAEIISNHEGKELSLDGLTSLSDIAAKALAKFKGDRLSLKSLTTISDAAARALAKFKGNLSLEGLTTLSPAAAISLSTKLHGERGLGLNPIKSKFWRDGEPDARQTALNRLMFRSFFSHRNQQRDKEVAAYCALSESGQAIARLEAWISQRRDITSIEFCSSMSVQSAVLLSEQKSGIRSPGFLGFYDGEKSDHDWLSMGDAVIRYLEKVHDFGPRCSSIGGQLIELMLASKQPRALGQLLRVAREIKQPDIRGWIESRVSWMAEDLGLQVQDIEDTGIDTHGLVAGGKQHQVPGQDVLLISTRSGKPEVWTQSKDGLMPLDLKALKKTDKEAAQSVTDELKAIQSTWKACARRLESSWCSNACWMWEDLERNWFSHPLVSQMAKKMIWRFEHSGAFADGMWHEKGFLDAAGKPLTTIAPDASVTVWHPADSPDTVVEWRRRILDLEIEQPIRQAFREVYLSTSAERNAGSSSARFAGHILRQNQFAALCRERGWSVSLVGPFDSCSSAEKRVRAHNLRIEWGGDGVGNDCEGTFYAFIRMKPVSFNVPVSKIPPIVFSEVMRDIDLFVSVSSIGVDPAWDSARENPEMQEYWTTFADGEIFESGKTRRETLKLLLPSLPCADRFALEKKYLTVTGKLGRYRIHLQSGAVFKQLANKHVCIVPKSTSPIDRRAVTIGDQMLSLIVSKALLLANDDQIKDKSILSQILEE